MENLFLYYNENKQLLDTKKRDLQKPDLFNNLFCFIDNLCSITHRLELDMNYKDKYPKNLELKKESILIFKRRLYTFQLLSKKKKKKKKN